MATNAAYAAGSDVQAFLSAIPNLTIPPGLDFDGAIGSAIEEFESRSGWLPFFSSGQTETRTYDPPGPPTGQQGYLLALRGGDQVLHVDPILTFVSLTVGGVAYAGGPGVSQPQFVLKPFNAPAYKKPYTQIEFVVPVFGAPQSIAITGVFGRCLVLHADVNPALIAKAAAILHPQIGLSISGGRALRKAGDEEEQYTRGQGTQPLQEQAGAWDDQFEAILRPGHYKRITL